MTPNIEALGDALLDVRPNRLAGAIVNTPFENQYEMVALGIGIIVFLFANERTGMIDRIALSRTSLAKGTVKMSDKEFHAIKIPIGHPENIIARAIDTREPQFTDDWKYLFIPALTAEQARMNQAGGGIACSYVYPLEFGGYSGAIIFSYFKFLDKIGGAEKEFMENYSRIASRALDRNAGDIETVMTTKSFPTR